MAGRAPLVVQALLLLAHLSAPAGAVMALGGVVQGLEDTSCHSNLYFRLISMTDYASDVDVAAASMLESAAARNCSQLFVRGVHGVDLGLGKQLYGASSHNFKTAQVLDFQSEADVDSFLQCQAQQPTTALLARLGRRTGHVKALIPASSCPQDAPGSSTLFSTQPSLVGGVMNGAMGSAAGSANLASPAAALVMDVYILAQPKSTAKTNSSQQQSSTALSKRLLALLRTASDHIVFALGGSAWASYDFLSRAETREQHGLVAGTAQFASVNLLRAYWAYLHGPPVVPQLAAATAAVHRVARVQMQPVQLKQATPSTLEGGAALSGQHMASMWAATMHQHWASASSSTS